ncbi:MAG: flagellar hook-length control protein FliK [Acidobacteriota bacterium]|nr:flagellar hook-length control protein FliK [Acidobacteriota bacterium]
MPLTAKAQEPPPLSPQSSSPPIKVDAAVPPEDVRVFGTTDLSPAAAATPEENAGRDAGRSSQDSSQRESAVSLAGLRWRTEHPASGSGGERQVLDQAAEITSVTGTPTRTAAKADAPEVETSRGTDVRSRDFVMPAADRIQMRTQELMPQPSSPSIKADVAASSEETVMREIADLSPAAADTPEEIAIPLSGEASDAAFESVAASASSSSLKSGKPLPEHIPPSSRSEASQDTDLPELKLEAPAKADAPEVEASRGTDMRSRDFVMQTPTIQPSSPSIKADVAALSEETVTSEIADLSPAAADTPEEIAIPLSSEESNTAVAAVASSTSWKSGEPLSEYVPMPSRSEASRDADLPELKLETPARADAPEVEASRGTDMRSRDFVMQAADRIQIRTQELMPQPSLPSIKSDVAASSEETVTSEIADLSPAAADTPEEIAIPLSGEESSTAVAAVASSTSWKSGKPLSEHIPPSSRSEASRDADLPELKLETPARADAPEESDGRDAGQSSQGSSQGEAAGAFSNLTWRTGTGQQGSGSGGERWGFDQAVEIAAATGTPIRTAAGAAASEIEASHGADARSRDLVTQVADRIQLQLRNGGGEIRIQLRPENLGKLEIRAEHGRDGLTARIATESREVKVLLESNLSSLQQMLEERGMKVNRLHIVVQDNTDTSGLSDGGNRSGHAFTGQQHRNTAQFSGRGETPDGGIETPAEEFADIPAARRPDSRFYTVA